MNIDARAKLAPISVAAVIPLYNKQATIIRAVRSVFVQTRLPDYLIVVDDGSSDSSSRECLNVFAEAPSGIECKLITQDNAGVSVARNTGSNAVSSDYIAFLDADDEWLPNHIAEICKLASSCPSAGILSCRHARLDRNGQPIPEPSHLGSDHFGEVLNGLRAYRLGYGILHTSTIAVSRAAWVKSGGFPAGARKSQDVHLWLRLLLNEKFAHSGSCAGIWHEEDTGVTARAGIVPCHFVFFLGTIEGQRYLANPELVSFLSVNLGSHVGGHRLRRDDEVVDKLVQLSRRLPRKSRIKVRMISMIPRRALQLFVVSKRRLKQGEKAGSIVK